MFDLDFVEVCIWRFEWIVYGNKNCSVLCKFCWILLRVVLYVCGCCRYRFVLEGDDVSVISLKKIKGDNKF